MHHCRVASIAHAQVTRVCGGVDRVPSGTVVTEGTVSLIAASAAAAYEGWCGSHKYVCNEVQTTVNITYACKRKEILLVLSKRSDLFQDAVEIHVSATKIDFDCQRCSCFWPGSILQVS